MSHRGRIASPLTVLAMSAGLSFSVACSTGVTADQRAADVNVSCAPSQRAVVKQTMAGGTPQVSVQCLDASAAVPAGFTASADDNVIRAAYSPAAVATPAVYYPREIVSSPGPVRAPRLTRASDAAAPVRRETKPSWKKRALIIGGSAGAGAGVGALVGGKKGALIGAAIGGGGATVLDQIKNR